MIYNDLKDQAMIKMRPDLGSVCDMNQDVNPYFDVDMQHGFDVRRVAQAELLVGYRARWRYGGT